MCELAEKFGIAEFKASDVVAIHRPPQQTGLASSCVCEVCVGAGKGAVDDFSNEIALSF